MMIKYKLVDENGYTQRGKKGETYWLDGLEKVGGNGSGMGGRKCGKCGIGGK